MNFEKSPHVVRWVRVVALMLMIGGYVAFVRANNAEATAIFDAGGDAGLWAVGIFFATALLIPGVVLLLVSIAVRPRTDGFSALAIVASAALLAPAAWLAANLYPPDKETDEGAPLNPAQWDHVADLYLFSFVLMGTAGTVLLVSAFPGLARRASGSTPYPPN